MNNIKIDDMKKRVFFYSLLALLLVGCSGEQADSVEQPNGSATQSNLGSVRFDAYQQRSITRSGWAGTLTLDQLKQPEANGGGFGVFAYYTDLKKYDQTYVPNFMYNQGVFWNSALGIFDYTPVVYWPNEYGFDASSDDEDHLTFFAYAPYVRHSSAAAGSVPDATYGIIGFSRNNATGDPMVRYVASFEPAKSVDLCWGVVPSDKTSWARIHNGSTQTLTEGLPWLDVYRPLETASKVDATTSRVKFKFNHALAQFNVQIDTDADVTTHQDGIDPDVLGPETKVYVRSISFTGLAMQGALNLNNTTPNQALWLDWCGCTDLSYGQKVTVHDGRRDGREGAAGAEATNETPQGLNPNIIQNSTPTDGVTPTYQNLFKPTSSNPSVALNEAICVIPTGEPMSITIVYDIETTNPKLATFISDGTTHGASIENKITKTVTFGGVYGAGLESNKRYTLKLHLGMNSVKFDADVSDWAENTVDGDAWLPSNTRPILLNKTVMYLGAAQTLTATTDPLGQPIIWDNTDGGTASFTGVAAIGAQHIDESYVNNTITMTPIALGTTTVTASLPSGDKATCEVHVVPVTITSRHNTAPNKTKGPDIAIVDTLLKTFTADLTPVCFGTTGVPPVNWTVSPGGVVSLSVNSSTQVCTVTALANGTATVTCTNTGYTSMPATYTIVVETKTPTVTAPTLATGWTYDAAAHDLLATAGSVTGGTMYYSPDNSNWYTNYQDVALKATNAGNYPIYYKVTGDPGYSDIPSTPIGTVMVAKATPTITLSATSGTGYAMGAPKTFTASLTSGAVTDGATLSVSSNNGTATLSSGTVTAQGASAGTATITVSSAASPNYNAASATYSLTVNAKTASMNPLSYVESTNISGTYGGAAVRNSDATYGDLYQYSQISTINTQAATESKHVPTSAEWFGIVPADYNSGSQTLPGYTTGTSKSYTVDIGDGAGGTKTLADNSVWYNDWTGNQTMYAVRFVGTDHCSLWKYHWTGSGLEISSMLIDYIDTTSAATTWLASNYSTSITGLLSSTNSFGACGYTHPSNTTLASSGTYGGYWSSTASGANAWYVGFSSSGIRMATNALGYGSSVRLFRNN